MGKKINFEKTKKIVNIEVVVAVIFIFAAMFVSVIYYLYEIDYHANNLKKTLVSIANTATLSIESESLSQINTPADVNTPVFINLVNNLKKVRDKNEDIAYVYIMRKTSDPHILSFIADADSLNTFTESDSNNNGIIDESEQVSMPGDLYDISEISAMSLAFTRPIADKDITIDKWGKFISAYAPIYNSEKEVVAILGVDVKAEDYYRLERRTELALMLSLFIFGTVLLIVFILIKHYRREIDFFHDLDNQKSDFIALASHQLRTPLAASKWCVDMLREGDYGNFDQAGQETIGKLCQSNERMISLVNDLLKVSQVDSDKIKAQFINTDINLLCDEIINEINHIIKEKNIVFSLHINLSTVNFKTDPTLLKEVILNLLLNAIKYTPANKEVELSIYQKNNKLNFKIRDEGYGIPIAEQKRIFTKFFRASNIIKIKSDGTGLGLYFAKKIVELLGGEISFTSEENKGSIFYFYLPI